MPYQDDHPPRRSNTEHILDWFARSNVCGLQCRMTKDQHLMPLVMSDPPPLPQIRSSSDSRATGQHSMNLLFSCLTIQTAIYLFIITTTRAPFYPWFWGHDLNLGSRLRRRSILYSLLIKMTLAGDANWGQKGWEQSISRICQKKSLWRHPCPHTHTLTVSDQILSGFSWQAINGLIFLLAI